MRSLDILQSLNNDYDIRGSENQDSSTNEQEENEGRDVVADESRVSKIRLG